MTWCDQSRSIDRDQRSRRGGDVAACGTSDRACNLSCRYSLKLLGTRGLIGVHWMCLIFTIDLKSYNDGD